MKIFLNFTYLHETSPGQKTDGNFLNFLKPSLEAGLRAHCRGADWANNTTKKKRIRQGLVISLYSEIHEDDNDLIPFILEAKYDPRALLLISTSSLANHNHNSVPLNISWPLRAMAFPKPMRH